MDRPTPTPDEKTPAAAEGSGSLWRRLRRNAAENGAALREAGVREDRVGQARCARCGAAESLVFWTPDGRSRDTLRLRCPYCERGKVRYGISRNRIYSPGERIGAVRAVSWTVIAVSCMVAAAVWFQGPEISRVVGFALNSSAERVPAPAIREGIRLPVGGSSAREASPLAGWWERIRPERRPAAATRAMVFVASGDRREEVQRLITTTAAADAVRELHYLPGEAGEAGVTRLVIDERASALVEALALQPGWSLEGGG
jgi:hypothetical protein